MHQEISKEPNGRINIIKTSKGGDVLCYFKSKAESSWTAAAWTSLMNIQL